MVLALLMLLFVSRMVLLGYYFVSEWQSESVLLAASGVLWSLTAPATIVSALWVLASLGRSGKGLSLGGGSIIASGIVLTTVDSHSRDAVQRDVLTARKTDFWRKFKS
jgi:hypothetical protein